MATSGVITFNPTLRDIIEEAWERATGQELRTGYEFRTAMRSYNILLLTWQVRGYNLWLVNSAVIPLVLGQQEYILPSDVGDVVGVTYAPATNASRLLRRISLPDYLAIPDKTVMGDTNYFVVNNTTADIRITLYPVPLNAVDVLTVTYTRRAQDGGGATNTADVPIRFIPALMAGLAFEVAKKIPAAAAKLPFLEADATALFTDASEDGRDKANTVITPAFYDI